jgi:8-hydroxy-5-deazaflavin:NADPH oxidoreductase
MTVAIIGTGTMGAGLARTLSSAGVDVVIGARDATKAAALAAEIGVTARGSGIAAALALANVAILAVPFGSVSRVLAEAGDLSGKVLIDITNPITADFKDLAIGHSTSAAEEIQKLAPGAKVVKAFNTIFGALLPIESRKGKSLQVFVAADDEAAKSEASAIAKAAGFEPVDAGPLRNARFIEPIGEMNIHFAFFLGWGPTAAPAWVHV